MLVLKTKPVGLDAIVQRFQTALHDKLVRVWGLSTDELKKLYVAHGRCYRNKTADGYKAEVYTGGSEYGDPLWDDTLRAISFVGVSQTIQATDTSKAHLAFFVDVAKIYPAITHRADEEIRRDVLQAIGANLGGFKVESIETGIDRVLAEYSATKKLLEAKMDMHPVHCFRVNLSFAYDPNKC